MKNFLLFILFIIPALSIAQVENAPLSNPVYDFLKEMSVKKMISDFDDGNPNLERFEIKKFLYQIKKQENELSSTEKSLLKKYIVEFDPSVISKENTFNLFDTKESLSYKMKNVFSDKQKYLYFYQTDENNIYVDFLGNLFLGKGIKNLGNKSAVMDAGFRARGTLFKHLGYYFSFNKGTTNGDGNLAQLMQPKLKTDFKFNENAESMRNYDFTNGYLKYYIEPVSNMNLSLQFGREKISFGYGYGSKLVLSGDNPDLDFLKINFKWGILNYSFIHASTVGEFQQNREDRYTKYIAANRIMLSIPNLFNFGINETVIYTGRIDFAYLNPVLLINFAEKSLQDRDNKTATFDFQTKFLKNIEFQGTLFLDDDEQFRFITGKTNRSERIGYQFGTFVYEPLGIKNLSFIIEYTKIRPYVYSHYDPKDRYTSYGINLGHRIGPNSDEIFSRLAYNISDWGRFNFEYQFIRKGNNIFDAQGNLVKNVGGDIFQTYRDGVDDPDAPFLAGERVNTNAFNLSFRYQPIKNFSFTFKYVYSIDYNETKDTKNDTSYGFLWMNIDY
jgi:hypothetical protein